jgi:hypothetical protein
MATEEASKMDNDPRIQVWGRVRDESGLRMARIHQGHALHACLIADQRGHRTDTAARGAGTGHREATLYAVSEIALLFEVPAQSTGLE